MSDNFSLNATAYMKQIWIEDLQGHRAESRFALDSNGNLVSNLIAMRFSKRLQFWDVDNANLYYNL